MIGKLFIIAAALAVIGAATAGALYDAYPVQMSIFGGLSRNYLLSLAPVQEFRLPKAQVRESLSWLPMSR